MLVLAPVACCLGAVAVSSTLERYTRHLHKTKGTSFNNKWDKHILIHKQSSKRRPRWTKGGRLRHCWWSQHAPCLLRFPLYLGTSKLIFTLFHYFLYFSIRLPLKLILPPLSSWLPNNMMALVWSSMISVSLTAGYLRTPNLMLVSWVGGITVINFLVCFLLFICIAFYFILLVVLMMIS